MSESALDGRRVVVTGAGMGLGAAYAEAAANAGAAVIVNDLDGDRAAQIAERISHNGGRAVPFAADVSVWASAGAIVEKCVEEFGGIDGLVNNAGIIGRVRPMLEETEDVARALLEVNVLGTLSVSVHAARAMVAGERGGAIVNVSSGNQAGHALVSTYGATKGAVSTLTYAWARELAEHGIRVNAISPNAHTTMIDDMIAQVGYNPEERDYPAPEHNAAVVAYLLSDASKKLNGQNVRVEHGRINVIGHPVVVQPIVSVDEWSVEGVARAFTGELGDHLQPLGLAEAEVRPVRVIL